MQKVYVIHSLGFRECCPAGARKSKGYGAGAITTCRLPTIFYGAGAQDDCSPRTAAAALLLQEFFFLRSHGESQSTTQGWHKNGCQRGNAPCITQTDTHLNCNDPKKTCINWGSWEYSCFTISQCFTHFISCGPSLFHEWKLDGWLQQQELCLALWGNSQLLCWGAPYQA